MLKALIPWLWKNRAHIALIALAVGAFFWLQAHDAKIRAAEQTTCKLAASEKRNGELEQTLTIKRRQDEIRNRPRSDVLTIERLRGHTF